MLWVAMIYHVVAMARNRVIGKNNQLPWHFSADLKHFKKLTMGETVIMGRKTFESIGRPLPGRANLVLSRTQSETAGPIQYFKSVQEAVSEVQTQHAFIIGGAQVYAETMAMIDGVYLTHIDQDFEGDAFYPEIPLEWRREPGEILQTDPNIQVFFYSKPCATNGRSPS